MSEVAINECVAELRAACRRPINETASNGCSTRLTELQADPDGLKERSIDRAWTAYARQRLLPALADFFSYQSDVDIVGDTQLIPGVRHGAACRVGAPASSEPKIRLRGGTERQPT